MKVLAYLLLVMICGATFSITASIPTLELMPALPAKPPIPEDNPTTLHKVTLGKKLYFDTRLSFTDKISCNSCHKLNQAGVDHQALSTGALGKQNQRNTPIVWNAAFQSVQFWDGRAGSLEAQVKDHLVDPLVMGMPDEQTMVERINAVPDYRRQFTEVFGDPNPVSYDTISKAIAAYERTLITPDSPFDRYVKGDQEAMSQQALRGMDEFQSVGCVACHFGINFSGPPVPMGEGFYELFPNYKGSQYDQKYNLLSDDLGRHEVTGQEIHKRLWRMPSLRNIALTAPYFHNGAVATLDEAVRVMAMTQLRKELTDQQVNDIVAFLKSLTGEFLGQIDHIHLEDNAKQFGISKE